MCSPQASFDHVLLSSIFSPWHLKAQEITHLCNRDCTAVVFNCGSEDVISASIYLDITMPVVSVWIGKLLNYAKDHVCGLVLAVDSNVHSPIYGPDQNACGTEVDNLLFRHDFHIENIGHTPTSQTSPRQSCIDLMAT